MRQFGLLFKAEATHFEIIAIQNKHIKLMRDNISTFHLAT